MDNFHIKVGTAKIIRELDRKTIEDYGLPGVVLMENAGRSAFDYIMEEFDPVSVTIFCGKGNNGGDGLCYSPSFNECGRDS